MRNLTLSSFRTISFFALILLEGYLVLSSEMLAIRQILPYVGNGTDTLSIVIASVLMPLAFGYRAGGHFNSGAQSNGKYQSLRDRLINNIFISLLILAPGLSYVAVEFFFKSLIGLGIQNRLVLTGLYSALVLVYPVYLLGQTIPLLSQYFTKHAAAKVTGKILFYSTIGSFLGAVFTTIVLMARLGVHHTVVINLVILFSLIVLFSRNKANCRILTSFCVILFAFLLNSSQMMAGLNIVENNQYNTIRFEQKQDERHLILSNNSSSMLTDDGRKHEYAEFIDRIAMDQIRSSGKRKDILVIGAGGFTLGLEDDRNHYDYVDIDASLKGLAEKHLLKEKLGENKHFHAVPARAMLSTSAKTYDLIILDAYRGGLTLPEQLTTVEFFKQVKSRLKPDARLVANFIVSPNFQDRFSANLDHTFRHVFENANRHIIGDYDLWSEEDAKPKNTIYTYVKPKQQHTPKLYTDNLNQVFLDKS